MRAPKERLALVLSGALVALAGCSPALLAPAPTAVPTRQATIAVISPATATWTSSPEPTETTFPTITPAPPTPTLLPPQTVPGVVSALRLNLRQGPGTTFPVLLSLAEGDLLIVYGKAQGEEWILVAIPPEEEDEEPQITGWVLAALVDLSTPLEFLAYSEVDQGWLVEGRVLTEDGTAVDGVSVAVTQGMDADELRTDAATLDNGRFYAYVPRENPGIWQVEVTGLDCSSSLMLASCRLQAGYYLSIPKVNVNVPNETPALLLFAFSEGGIHGTVSVFSEVVEDVRVRGESTSGALSWAYTRADGSYELALGEGVWTVFAVDDSTGRQSGRMTVALGAGQLLTDVKINIP